MKYENTKKIKEHLEYLGYEVADETKPENTRDVFFAKHAGHYYIRVFMDGYDIGCLVAMISGFDKELIQKMEFFKALVAINYKSNFTKWSVTEQSAKEGLIVIDTCLIGYEKQRFGVIIEKFNEEINSYIKDLFAFIEEK
jgi:hypothetical protein